MIACKDHAKNPIKGYFACPGCEVQMLRDEVKRIKAENEALRKDAERYRWLRDPAAAIVVRDARSHMRGVYMDAQIDAAIAKESK